LTEGDGLEELLFEAEISVIAKEGEEDPA